MELIIPDILNFADGGLALASLALAQMANAASTFAAVFAAAAVAFFDSDSDALGIYAILIGGPAFYGYVYMRYRNTNQRHTYEQETPVEISNLQQYDNYVEQLKRQNTAYIPGTNDQSVTGSLLGGQASAGSDLSGKLIGMAMNSSFGRPLVSGDVSFGKAAKRDAQLTKKLKERKRGGR